MDSLDSSVERIFLADLDDSLQKGPEIRLLMAAVRGGLLGLRKGIDVFRRYRSVRKNEAGEAFENFKNEVYKLYGELLKGQSEVFIRTLYQRVHDTDRAFPGAIDFLQELIRADIQIKVITGSHDVFARGFFDHHRDELNPEKIQVVGAEYERKEALFTGEFLGCATTQQEKAETINDLKGDDSGSEAEVVGCLGNSIRDLPMFLAVKEDGLRLLTQRDHLLWNALKENGFEIYEDIGQFMNADPKKRILFLGEDPHVSFKELTAARVREVLGIAS